MTTATKREQRLADGLEVDRARLCAAERCPNRWCVDAGSGRLCSAHAWLASRNAWPLVTQEQLDAETDRARYAGSRRPSPARVDRTAALQRLATLRVGSQAGARDWAASLRRRDAAGEKLTLAQREAWRSVATVEQVQEADQWD